MYVNNKAAMAVSYTEVISVVVCPGQDGKRYQSAPGENISRNAEYGMRNSPTYTLRNYSCGMFGYLLAVGNYCKFSHALIQ